MARLHVFVLVLPVLLTAADLPEIRNMQAVNDHIYRGAQPSVEGFKQLAKMGIKTVIDLRDKPAQADREKQIVESHGMKYVGVPMSMHAPTDDQIGKRSLRDSLCDHSGFSGGVFGSGRRPGAQARYRHDGVASSRKRAEYFG